MKDLGVSAMPRNVLRTVLLVLAALGVSGCKKTITLQHYPDFYRQEYKTLALWEIRNDSTRRRAGELMTRKVVSAFESNGTYKVVGPEELKQKLAAQIGSGEEFSDSQIAALAGNIKGVDLVLTSVVESYRTRRTVYYSYRRGYAPAYPSSSFHVGSSWGSYPHYGLAYRYPVFPSRESLIEAHVAAEAALWSSDGRKLHQSPLLELWRESDEPAKAQQLLSDTADLLASRIVGEFAIAPVEVEVDPGKALYTGRRENSRLVKTDDFYADQEEMLVRVELPRQADRNKLAIRIRPEKGSTEALAAESFTFDAAQGIHEIAFSPAQIYQAAGKGEYILELHGRAGLLLEEDFNIHE